MDYASLRACAKAFRKLVASNADVLLDAVFELVNLLDREHADRWTVVGDHRTLVAKFRALAARAAVAAGVADASWSEQAKLEAWLDLLMRKTQRRMGDGDILARPIHVSIEVCDLLVRREKKVERRFPERAEFFRKKNLNPMAIELKVGLSHNTTKRILEAKAVRKGSLDKLAEYYSIDPGDIPDR
jgi:DNA-binding Xre family transcriptional regulator